jgi:hypothetical protein
MSYSQTSLIAIVIKTYGLALDDRQVEAVLVTWLQTYDSAWIIKALVESLYRGRYKLISVDNILKDWQRIGKPRYNFTPEYEREIFQKIPICEDRTDWELLPVASGEKSTSVVSVDAGNVESVGTESYYIIYASRSSCSIEHTKSQSRRIGTFSLSPSFGSGCADPSTPG